MERLAVTISRRGLCIVISDLLDDPDAVIRGLRHLRFKRQDVMVLWVIDPLENEFSRTGTLDVRDLESGGTIALDGKTATEFFSGGIQHHRLKIEEACRSLHVGFEPVVTSEPFAKALLRIINKRRRMF
jgi:hypothetical protein